jgi:hypothetical protein
MSIPKSKGEMEFRDFRCFHKTLLAKKCWWLWRSPDSLVSQIMSAKYNANSSLLQAKLGSKPSYGWRSILGSCYLLKEGLLWRIGNGEDTKIWGDKWIPRTTTFTIQSTPRLLNLDAKVAELLDRDGFGWKKDLIETLFFLEEAEAILVVPINLSRQDVVIWREMSNGQFTVKSASMNKVSQQQAGCTHIDKNKKMWVSLWKLQIPNVEKNFLWRACHKILPTKASLLSSQGNSGCIVPNFWS